MAKRLFKENVIIANALAVFTEISVLDEFCGKCDIKRNEWLK